MERNIPRSTRFGRQALRLLQSPLLNPLNDIRALDDLLAQANPLWSLTHIRARIVEIRDETADVKTFVLKPNRRWLGFVAGQHVSVELDVDGVRRIRTFSVASAPQNSRRIELTIKRHPKGLVTGWLHARTKVGDLLTLSRPAGDFVLPTLVSQRMLMLSAGSGITPLMSMLRDLQQRRHQGRIAFVHVCRTPQDAIFGDELRAIAQTMPNLSLQIHSDSDSGAFDMAALEKLVPDFRARETYLCGPDGFMQVVRDHWAANKGQGTLHFERFGAPRRQPKSAGQAVEVRAARAERIFSADGSRPLLEDAEAAGLNPKYGCRIGICQTCKCRKTSGTVQNLLTGELSSEPGEMIQLCITAARTDVTLEL